MSRKTWILLGFFLALALFPLIRSFTVTIAGDWVVEGNKVYIDDENVYISADPHTLHQSGWVYFNLTSKTYEGNADVIFGFNTTTAKPIKAELYKPHEVNTTYSYTCNEDYFNYTLSPKHFWCWKNVTDYAPNATHNQTVVGWHYKKVYDRDFEWGPLSEKKAYWNIPHTENYIDVTNRFTSINYDFKDMNKWYYVTDVPIQKDKSYIFRAYITIPIKLGTSKGKYWFAIKPSSESIQEAISNNHFYYLDPWWDKTYNYRYKILTNGTVLNMPYSINDTGLINDIQYWTQNTSETIYLYCENSGCGSELVAVGNDTHEKYWENSTFGKGNSPTSVWGSNAVYISHLEDTNANDSSSNNHQTFVTHGSPSVVSGVFGDALKFFGDGNGNADIIDLTSATGSQGLNKGNTFTELTFSMWINFSTDVYEGAVHRATVFYEYSPSGYYFLDNRPFNSQRIFAYLGVGAGCNPTYNTIDLNKWYHLVMKWDGAGFTIFVNGVNVSSVACSGTISTSTMNVTLGGIYSGENWLGFNGTIDELQVYNHSKSNTWIKEQYFNGIHAHNFSALGIKESQGTINFNITNTNLYLNGTEANQVLTYGDVSNITATVNASDLYVAIYRNGTLMGNNTPSIENITDISWFKNATYNITAYTHGNITHNSSSKTLWIHMNKDSTTIFLAINGTEGNINIGYPEASNATAWKTISDGVQTLMRNGSIVSNPELIQLSARSYNYTTNFTHENYTATPISRFLTINKGSSNVSLYMNGTRANQTVTYPNTTNQTATLNASGIFYLYKNGTQINSGPDRLENVTEYSAGVYNFTASFPGDENNTADSETYFLTISKASSGLTLTVSPSWIVNENAQVIITCSANIGYSLYKDGVNVSSPYSTTLPFGTYNFTCVLADEYNYTPSSTKQTLTVRSGGFGCTDTTTFAFKKSIDISGDIVIVNFTSLVNNSYVHDNLGDVYINLTNATTKKQVISNKLYYFIIDTENATGIKNLEFGNYIVNETYSNDTTTAISSVNYSLISYDEQNDYFVLNFYDEKTGTFLLPPSTNNSVDLFCSGGFTSFDLNKTRLLVSSFEDLDDMKVTVQYSSTEIYYRNLIVRSDVEHRNFYVVDANEYQVVEILFTLQDDTGDFDDADLKVKKYLEGTLQTITELGFDAQSKAVAYFINGDKYQLYVDSGIEERNIGFLYVDSTDLEKTIVIGDITTTNITHGNISFLLNMSDGIISFSWVDPGENTNLIEFWVYNYTTNEQLYYASSTNRSIVNFNYVTPNASASYIAKYLVKHGIFGNTTTGKQIIFAGVYGYPTVFPLTTLITSLGGSSILWLTLLFIIPIPMLFTEKYVGVGAFVLVAVVGLFAYWKMYSISAGILALGLFIAVMIYIKSKRRGS